MLILFYDANRNQWAMVKVVRINSEANDFVQNVKLLNWKTRNDGEQILERPLHKVVLLKESLDSPTKMPSVKMVWHFEGNQYCYRHFVGETA